YLEYFAELKSVKCFKVGAYQSASFSKVVKNRSKTDIVDGLILVGENGYGDEFGIGSKEAFTILEVAKMYNVEIKMLPERRGNRMTAEVVSSKTKALGWTPKRKLQDYIDECRKNDWR
ncbi:MAG: hypothetical protein JJV95_01480, partial [Sulfurospirillum sp.]|nr:hypothetical protein [Sulfurospirillum sp.]